MSKLTSAGRSVRLTSCLSAFVLVGGMLWLPDVQANEKRILRGRVQDADALRLNRPVAPGIGQSVSILNGGSFTRPSDNPLVRAQTEQDVIDLSLKGENFALRPLRRMTPQSGWLPETSVEMGATGSHESLLPEEVQLYELGGAGWNRMMRKRQGHVHHWPAAEEWSIHKQAVSGQLASSQTESLLSPTDYDPIPEMSRVPMIRVPSFSRVPQWQPQKFTPVYEDKYVTWDQWYKLVADGLWKKWSSSGHAEPGEADLRITVDKAGKVDAKILNTNNLNLSFKKGILQAAVALSGAPILKFPAQSERTSVSFDTHFSAGVGTVSGAWSQRANDVERTRIKH